MRPFLDALRDGSWLTRARMRRIAFAVLAASLAGLAFLVATSDGLNDYQGRPLATDFSNVYAAGSYVLDGRAAAPFDPASQYAREQAIFGAKTQFYGWHYPPFFLFVAAALALMPYALSLALWQSGTFALYLGAMAGIARTAPQAPRIDRTWLLLAAAFPAVFVNLGHGHNGFLTAALLASALLVIDARPVLSGILFGLLAYKPQFGLLIPIVLAASGRWRTFFAAAATVGAMIAVTTAVFGMQIWDAFFGSMHFTRTIVLEAGETGWHKIQSVFSWVRMWGGPVPLAYAIQGAATLTLAVSLGWLWRSKAAIELKAAALATGMILATPYSLDYDMTVLSVAIGFFAVHGLRRGFRDDEATALALLWIAPLIARMVAQQALIPLGVLAMGGVYALIMRRAIADTARGSARNPARARRHRIRPA